ncbi:MAG: hypothetical protein ABS948_01895 [Solibacillus sp.]
MKLAKFVMFLYTLAAIGSMMGIGFCASLVFMAGTDQYDTIGIIGIFACIIAVCAVFMLAFIQKKKFKNAGLL